MVHSHEDGESEPLLGRPGDATQHGQPILMNVWIGTGVLAQAGIFILAATVWAAIFEGNISLFSAHPLLNVSALLLITQAILVLQPTNTAVQKHEGTRLHFALHSVAVLALLIGLVIIEYSKISHNGAHFTAIHNYLGVAFYALIGLQAVVGVTQYFTPSLYGGVDNAKKIWKFHRMGGYVTLLMGLATVCSVYATGWNKAVGGLRLWPLVVSSVLVVLGVLPRVKMAKLGWKKESTV